MKRDERDHPKADMMTNGLWSLTIFEFSIIITRNNYSKGSAI